MRKKGECNWTRVKPEAELTAVKLELTAVKNHLTAVKSQITAVKIQIKDNKQTGYHATPTKYKCHATNACTDHQSTNPSHVTGT